MSRVKRLLNSHTIPDHPTADFCSNSNLTSNRGTLYSTVRTTHINPSNLIICVDSNSSGSEELLGSSNEIPGDRGVPSNSTSDYLRVDLNRNATSFQPPNIATVNDDTLNSTANSLSDHLNESQNLQQA